MEKKQPMWWRHALLFGILLAFAGCFIGLNMVYKGTPYRGVDWAHKRMYTELVNAVTDTSRSVDTLTTHIEPDTALLRRKPTLLRCVVLLTDTQFYNKYWQGKIRIDTGSLQTDSSLTGNLLREKDSVISLVMADTSLTANLIRGKVALRFRPANAAETFSLYPSVGIWALLIVMQLTLFFFLFPYALFLLFTIPKNAQYSEWEVAGWLQRSLYLLAVAAVLIGFYMMVMYSSDLVKPAYIMPGLNKVLSFTNVCGYITIAALLAAALSCVPDASAYSHASDAASQEVLAAIEKKMNGIFLITAVLLSLGISSTGTLYNALNSLPFVHQLNTDLGFKLFSNDAPLLYGIIHSCILLVFFIPIRKMIASAKMQVAVNIAAASPGFVPADARTAAAAADTSTIKKITDVFIAGVPSLVALLQVLFDIILN